MRHYMQHCICCNLINPARKSELHKMNAFGMPQDQDNYKLENGHAEGETLPPHAGPLAEALRDIGYSLEAAVADIIDNCITAEPQQVDIRFGWENSEPWIAIIDNGEGMSQAELLEAMRPGSHSPRDQRRRNDLGRFGLGLKTASFSQCRRLTVVSRRNETTTARCWDLDEVGRRNKWILIALRPDAVGVLPAIEELEDQGTYVLWQKIDRLDLGSYATKAHANLNDRIATVRQHLSLVFHRFLVGEPGLQRISIKINNQPVEPFDPFNARNPATQHLPEERIALDGETVLLQPYILPHHSKVTASEYEKMGGEDGYLKAQGFYIYRNRRLIIHGTWFRLARQEELTKLARVRIDIPNTLDHLWNIDVRKSRAYPPEIVKQRMRQIVDRIRGAAKRPYSHRGVVIEKRDSSPVWQRKVFNDRITYEVDLNHPLIAGFRMDLDESMRRRLGTLVQMIGASFPAPLFYSDIASNPERSEPAVPDRTLFQNMAEMVYAQNEGITSSKLKNIFLSIEPFASYPDVIDELVKRTQESGK
jgi:hypothetical protein